MTANPDTIKHTTEASSLREETKKWARQQTLSAPLVVTDAVAVMVAFTAAYLIRFKIGLPVLQMPPHELDFYTGLTLMTMPIWIALFALHRLYDERYLFTGFQEYTRIMQACTMGVTVLMVLSFLNENLYISRGWLVIVWVLTMLFIGIERFTARRVLRWARRQGHLIVPTLIIGANEEGRALAEQFLADPSSGTRIVGFVDNTLDAGTAVCEHLQSLGGLAELDTVLSVSQVKQIIIATTAVNRDELLDLYRTYGQSEDMEIRLSSGLFEILTTGITVQEISCVPLMTPQKVRIRGVDAALKAMLDYPAAFLGLIFLTPTLLALALAIKLDSKGPVLHRRRVLGRNGKTFDAFKFRTMVTNADEILNNNPELREAFEKGFKLKTDPRVTKVGRILRRASLDELPQLLNVLRGEMSLVGPRMIVPEEAPKYGQWQLNLLTVKPGITGPWQAYGRADILYEERVRLSMQYIRNYSIWLDLEILINTFMAVVKGSGAY
jgi:exopolysaccharide biosynthesis polyprenyl glycosylphosphotransferase